MPRTTGKRVVFLGRICGPKGPQILIDAIPSILRKFPRTQFIFIGAEMENGFVAKLRSRAEALQINNNVFFTGRLPEAARYLRLFDLFVLPSLNEPLGRVTAEAMYAELPIVATDTGGTREIIQHGKTGRLVPPGDPELLAQEILFYLENDRIGKEHGRSARERALELFHPAAYAKAIEHIYGEILHQRSDR